MMLPPEIRRKLARLNVSRQPPAASSQQSDASGADSSQFTVDSSPSGDASHIATSGVEHPGARRLEDILPGRVHEHEGGRLYVVERRVETLYPAGKEKIAAAVQEVRQLGREPEEAVFLDVETCGLANCPLFLVGILSVRETETGEGEAPAEPAREDPRPPGMHVRIEQYFARDYTEEASLLAYLAEVISAYRMLITFNGRTFDIPYMRDRMTFHRLEYEFEHEHFDLLFEARRLWRDKLPDCRLQTLEEHIVGRRRFGDTPGHLIPQLYHDFVRTGNAALIEGVFHHNALDLITMAELLPVVTRRRGDAAMGR